VDAFPKDNLYPASPLAQDYHVNRLTVFQAHLDLLIAHRYSLRLMGLR
jgi:hypothetical protein